MSKWRPSDLSSLRRLRCARHRLLLGCPLLHARVTSKSAALVLRLRLEVQVEFRNFLAAGQRVVKMALALRLAEPALLLRVARVVARGLLLLGLASGSGRLLGRCADSVPQLLVLSLRGLDTGLAVRRCHALRHGARLLLHRMDRLHFISTLKIY